MARHSPPTRGAAAAVAFASLVVKGRRATPHITGLALCVLLREGNAVAVLCAAASFAKLLLGRCAAAATTSFAALRSTSCRRHMLATLHPAPLGCPSRVSDPKLKVEEGKMKAVPQKLTGSRSRVIPKQEEVPAAKATRAVATNKKASQAMIIIDSDDDSEGRTSCVILKPSGLGDSECHLMKEAAEASQQILRRARKRRRREMQVIVPAA